MATSPSRIQVKCGCGVTLAVPAERAGTRGTCPKCGRQVTIPAAGADSYVAKDKQKVGPSSTARLPAPAGAAGTSIPRAKGTSPLLLLVGAGVGVLLLAGVCGGVSLGIWLALRPAGTAPAQASRNGPDKGAPSTPAGKPGDKPPAGRGDGKPARPLDLSHIPGDAGAAIVLRPRKVLASPLVPALPPGAAEAMIQELGVKPEQVEELIVLLPAGAPTPAKPPLPPDTWVAVDSRDGRFSLRFPLKPKQSERKTPLGTRQVFTAEDDKGELMLEVSYIDFPKDSPIVGDLSRVDFGTRALEFKPGFKDKKDIKLGKYPGAEVVLDDAQLRTYSVHRVYVAGDRLYHLEATTRRPQKPPAEFARFFSSFQIPGAGAEAPAPAEFLPPELMPTPGAIVRFTAPVDGKQLLSKLLKGLREAKHEGKVYYVGPDEDGLFGIPVAGHVADDRTLLLAPEPLLHKMLTAAGAKGPLLDRLRQADANDDLTAVIPMEPFRKTLTTLARPNQGLLPPPLAGAVNLPEQLVCVTATVNLNDKTLARLTLDANNEASAQAVEKLAGAALGLARQAYPDLRAGLAGQLPPEALGLLRVADQLHDGVHVTREATRVIVTLDRPAGLDLPAGLIAAAGFNDAEGVFSDPVPSSPYPLGSNNRVGGIGEPGWAGAWDPSSPSISYQNKVVFEGDGAVHVKPTGNVSYSRRLARPQQGVFQIEQYVQVPEGGSLTLYVNNGNQPRRDGPVWQVQRGQFEVVEAGVPPGTGIACQPGKWHKVTLQVDVPRKQWSFLVDDRRFLPHQPLKFLSANEPQLDTLAFWSHTPAGFYLDALRITRLPDDALEQIFARERAVALPAGHIAAAGFNDADGLLSDAVPGSPYAFGAKGLASGVGEPGWAGPWEPPGHPATTFQKKVVFEGDGAAHVTGVDNVGPAFYRRLAEPQRGVFLVEQYVQVPEGGTVVVYFKNGDQPFRDGPVWQVQQGKFQVGEAGVPPDTGFACQPGKWYKVSLRIDVPKGQWEFSVDGKRFVPPQPLKFRSNQPQLDTISYLCGTGPGIYLDALRLTRLPK